MNINYPIVKKYIIVISKVTPNKTPFEEFLDVVCRLLIESKVIVNLNKTSCPLQAKLLAFSRNVLKNEGWEFKRKQVTQTYFYDGVSFPVKKIKTVLIRPQEE